VLLSTAPRCARSDRGAAWTGYPPPEARAADDPRAARVDGGAAQTTPLPTDDGGDLGGLIPDHLEHESELYPVEVRDWVHAAPGLPTAARRAHAQLAARHQRRRRGLPDDLEEIARVLRGSRERVRQIEARALNCDRLRRRLAGCT